MGRRRKRRTRRPPQDHTQVAALDEVRHVGVPLADRLGLEPARAEPLGVEKCLERLADEERRLLELRRLARGIHDVE